MVDPVWSHALWVTIGSAAGHRTDRVYVVYSMLKQSNIQITFCGDVCLQRHVCLEGANRILLPGSQLCPADESQEGPAYVYGYHAEAPAWNHV